MLSSIATVSFLLFIGTANTQTPLVNVALNKPVTALGTCGSPAEDYYAHTEISKPSQDRIRSICDSSSPTLAYPPSNTVDDESVLVDQEYTWWQSASKIKLQTLGLDDPEAVITVDLQEVYTIQDISIQMGDSVRPGQLAILESIDGVEFIPWEYRVSSPQDCLEVFDVSSANTDVESLASVLCRTYTNTQAQPRNEIINFEFDVPDTLSAWQETKYIRFEFYNMPRSFGFLSDEYHHYTVRNIEALAFCNCNGHAAECTLQTSLTDPSVQTYQCVCQGNTQGTNCEECLPFYNQQAYQTGENGFVCESCFCYGHSGACSYDADMEANNMSQIAPGVFSGGGVCTDCQDNTAGINCETCQRFYYRPINTNQSDVDACQPCECFFPGTREQPDLGIHSTGECVISADLFFSEIGLVPGDCFCKANVTGSKCDECMSSTYDLQEDNPDGCRNCDCTPEGSVNGSDTCDTTNGQCPCKAMTVNRRCDQCLDGFFNLTSINPEGCSDCDCDVGGALSDVCDQGDGSCDCRRGVTGRQCNSAALSRYIPSLHYISAEFEDFGRLESDVAYTGYKAFGYITLVGTASVTVSLTIPSFSEGFEVLLRSITQGLTRVALSFTPGLGTSGGPVTGTVSVPLCTSWCYVIVTNSELGQGEVFTLSPGVWEVRLDTTLQGGAKILLDQIAAVPVEFLRSTEDLFGAAVARRFESSCDVRSDDLSVGTENEEFCRSSVFSLITYFLDGTMGCDCDIVGSISDQCDQWGGACECKPGIGGQRCDRCLPQYYGFGFTGCIACGCFGDNEVCDSVTGQCDCPPHTVGRQCDRCVTFSYGLDSTTGCTMCNCIRAGSVNLQCDAGGQCPCKPGVGARDCSSCLPDHKMFTDRGCDPCSCNRAGSLHERCNQTTGQCDCKVGVTGLTCNECSPESFFLSRDNQEGCLGCVCMGITGECRSSTHRYTRFDLDADQLPDNLPVNSPLGWEIPETFLSGDLLSLYGGELVLSITYEAQATLNVTAEVLLMSDYGQAVFTAFLIEPFVETIINIPIEEGHWATADSGPILRSDFLRMLVGVRGFMVSATRAASQHSSRISGVHYFKATSQDSPNYEAGAPQAFPVEECACGEGYEGLSCQYCAEGFFRQDADTHLFFGTCQRCECNGHSESCDIDTGECLECDHNTAGFSCEVCTDGFYGDATNGTPNDCPQCPCNNRRTTAPTCDIIDGTLRCLSCAEGHTGPLCDVCDDSYYGSPEQPDGFCTRCDCSGNSLQCDSTTGMCIGCQHRTEGFNCGRCQPFLYGNATEQDCRDCNCMPDGSANLLCDTLSGQCPCLPNITGRECDQCLPNHYGYGDLEGCQPCECNQFGSTDLQCSGDGMCQCYADAIGDKCDRCTGSFGLPDAECQSCGCDPLGTVGGDSALCHPRTGQCPCLPGLGGRTCDQCAIGYVENDEGVCNTCDLCVETLIDSAEDILNQSQNLSAAYAVLEQYRSRDATLQILDTVIDDSLSEMRVHLEQLDLIRAELEGINVENITRQTDDLQNLTLSLFFAVAGELSSSYAELSRIGAIGEATAAANQASVDLQQVANDYVAMVTAWNASLYAKTQEAGSSTNEILGTSFDNFERVINLELEKSLAALQTAIAYKNETDQQAAEADSLSQVLGATNLVIGEIRNNISMVQSSLETAERDVSGITALENETYALLKSTEELLEQAVDQLDTLTSLDEEARSAVTEADRAHSDVETILRGPWSESRSSVESMTQSIAEMRAELLPLVEDAEDHAQSLELNVLTSRNILRNAQTGSQLAVEAVLIYEQVVIVVREAQYLAGNASEISQSVADRILARNLSLLEQEAASLKAASSQILDQITNLDFDVAGMLQGITAANTTVGEVEELQALIDSDTEQLISLAEDLQQQISESTLDESIISARNDSDAALRYSNDLSENITALNASLQGSHASIQSLENQVTDGTLLIESFPERVSSLEDTEVVISQHLATLDQMSNQTIQLRSSIENRMASIRAKLARAQTRLMNSKLPARFEGSNSTLELIAYSPVRQTNFDEIGLRFRTEQRDGLLFFTENPEGQSFLSLEIIASRVVFRFRINDDIVRIQSLVDVCCGEWFQVLASRYANQGHLTITKLTTGGTSTDFARSPNIFMMYMQFQANTTLHVGGVLSSHQVDLALSRDFTGCIADVSFEREVFDLWQPSYIRGSISCCEGPRTPEPPVPPTTEGISLDGFGHLQLPSSDLDIHTQSSFSLEFRTSVKEAVMLSITRTDLISYIGIFLSDGGRVVFDMNTSGNTRYKITSGERYNNAQWYKVLVSYNSSHHGMELSYDNGTAREDIQRRTLYALSFPNLRYSAQFSLGSAEIGRGPTDLGFAGCLRNLYMDSKLIEINGNTTVSHAGVGFDTCLAEVTEGFGFRGDFAYAELNLPDQLSSTRSIQFYFKTTAPHGILAYAFTSTKLFYVTLYHGNIFIQYNNGQGLSKPLQTKGEWLNTGQWQLVTIQFDALGVSLKVNSGATIYSSRQLGTDGIGIDGALYLGGVPATFPFLVGGQFPVRRSLSGDIKQFSINDFSPNLNDPIIVTRRDGLLLHGVPPAVSMIPDLPYPTSPPGQGTAAPRSCRPPVEVIPYPGAYRLGASGDGYLAFNLDPEQAAYFLTSFVATIQFRAHTPDGVLYYAANERETPTEWFALLLREGKLAFNMMTSSGRDTGLDVITKEKYDSGRWYQVLVLRINDFVALLVDETDEYVNNGETTAGVISQIRVQTNLYLGELGQGIANDHISALVDGRFFDGCIRMFEASGNFAQDLVFPLSSPSESKNVEPCEQNDISLDTYFMGVGYSQLYDDFNVTSNFVVQVDFTTSQREALLFAVVQNKSSFLVLELFDGGMRAVVNRGMSHPTVIRASGIGEFDLCDGQQHTVVVTLTETSIEITVDGGNTERTPISEASGTIRGSVFIGGIPDDRVQELTTGISTASLQGCVTNLSLNGGHRDMQDYVQRSGVRRGCPARIP